MISIHTNLSSIITQNSLSTSTNKLNHAIERMTTGYKVNHAKDNAAGYSIITDMKTKLGAYQVAEDNVAAGLDLLATVNDTLALMQDKASRLHALSTQARNGTYGASSLDAINSEANAIFSEIQRLYLSTRYNGIDLFSQKEYDIPDHLPKAKDEYNGFISNPIDYSDAQVAAMIKLETISDTATISSGQYSISSLEELVQLAEMTNSGKITGGEFVLGADLDLGSIENWIPIGNNSTNYFNGSFNGNGHVIKNLKINRPTESFQGLFGRARGSIGNVRLINVNVKGSDYVGGVVGESSQALIKNCYVSGDIFGSNGFVGGVTGIVTNIYYSYFIGNVTGETQVGGLCGHAYSVFDSYAKGSVSGKRIIGGVIGQAKNITNSYATGNVTGEFYIGGLVGQVPAEVDTRVIQDSVSYSRVNGQDNATTGSFIGAITNTTDNITFGTLNINNCQSIARDINKIGGIYKNDSSDSIQNDMTTMLAGISDVAIRDISTNLQIGIYGDSSSQISFDMNFELSLNLGAGIDSIGALNSINSFMTLLSEKQTELGAVQNRLESALNSIEVNIQNLTSSRSTLRDADIAKESARFVQEQILQEASATLLATANQTPAIALQLI